MFALYLSSINYSFWSATFFGAKCVTSYAIFLLEFKLVSRESAEVLCEYLLLVLDQTRLKEKLIGFCANSFNNNFGSVERRGQNNVFFKVKDNVTRDLVVIGCRVHTVHNCFQHAVDTLPICVESLAAERSTFLYLVLSALTQVAGFIPCFLKVCKHHHTTSFCQWHLPFSVQSDWYVLSIVFSTSHLVAQALLFPPL